MTPTTDAPTTNPDDLIPDPLPEPERFYMTERQEDLFKFIETCEENESTGLIGYGGAMGGGKTRALAELAYDLANRHPGTRILVARLHYTDLRNTTMRAFFERCPQDQILHHRRSQPESVVLRTGREPSTVHFRHLSEWRGLGSEQYGAVLIDEAAEIPVEAAQMLITRLRHPAQPARFFVAASNPWPGWFERWFVRRELPFDTLEDSTQHPNLKLRFIPAKIRDNPHLPPDYEQLQRLLLPDDWVDRFIDGNFHNLLGLVYADFDRHQHRWDADLPPFAAYVGGIDFGGLAPHHHHTAAVIAGLTARNAPCGAGVLIRLAEFEERGPEVINRLETWMRQHERRLRRRIRWRADRTQSAWIAQMRKAGFHIAPSTPGPHSVIAGINLVQRRLAGKTRPRSYYTPDMPKFPERMLNYRWLSPSESTSPIPQPKKHNDDLMDADRYLHEQADNPTNPPKPARLQILR